MMTPYPTPVIGEVALPPRPTIFIECTHTDHSDMNTGIQRVVRNILRNAPAIAEQHGYDIVPVTLEGDRFCFVALDHVLANRQSTPTAAAPAPSPASPLTLKQRARLALRPVWRLALRGLAAILPTSAYTYLYARPDRTGLARLLLLVASRLGLAKRPPALIRPDSRPGLDHFSRVDGSILLLLDATWALPVWPATQRFKQRGGMVVGTIYDLIPITHSHTCLPEHIAVFKAWLAGQFRWADGFVCISKSVASELATTIAGGKGQPLSRAPIRHFYLGSELDFIQHDDLVRPAISDIFEADRHAFLMVGSIEPRKNHAYVLDAFDRFWAVGGTAALVIVGRHGWKSDDFLARVARHPQLGHQLFILRDATDAELDHCYRNASSLIIASEIEGFGLPVVEAFQRGLPVMCSDIPVFREIAEGKAAFFSLDDPQHLTAALEKFCREVNLAQRRDRRPQSWIGWRQSTEQLIDAILDVRQHPEAGGAPTG